MEKPRVLLVDDDQDMIECLEIALADDFDIASSTNGADALRALKTKEFDAVVLDLMMPEVDGIHVLNALRAQGAGTPVLLASAMPDLEATAGDFGAAGWINKPYALDELCEKIQELVRGPKSSAAFCPDRSQPAPVPTSQAGARETDQAARLG